MWYVISWSTAVLDENRQQINFKLMVISMDNLKKIYSSKFVTCFGGDLLLVKRDFLLLSIGTFVTCFGGDLLLVKQDFLLLSIGTLDPSLLPVLEEIYFWLNEIFYYYLWEL